MFCAENDNTGELLNVGSCDYVIQQFCVKQTLRFSLCVIAVKVLLVKNFFFVSLSVC
jgi:hypothetical protein